MIKLNDSEIAKRLKELKADKRLKSARAFALSIDADPSFFDKILKGEKSLTENYLSALVLKYGVNEKWILFGEGEKYRPNIPHGTSKNEEQELLALLIELMKRQNVILERQTNNVEKKVERIDVNLDSVLVNQREILAMQTGYHDAILENLAAIRKVKPEVEIRNARKKGVENVTTMEKRGKLMGSGK